ncbi:MAG TPA: lipoprotein [Dokdonella sp.]|nr:lipoprotein [Dokdonella sp.]
MLRMTRPLAVLALLILLTACGSKGDLLKPSAAPADKPAVAAQG